MNIHVSQEYEALLPKLSKEDYELLKESIKNDGLHYVIAVNKDGVILDGHHRFKICNELGIEARFEVKEFPNTLLEKKFVIESNLKRRHLNKFQRARLMLPLLAIMKELVKGQGERIDLQDVRNISHISSQKKQRKPLTPEQKEARKLKKPKRTAKIVAEKIQMSGRTLEKAKTIIREAEKEPEKYAGLLERVDAGEVSISSAERQIKRDKLLSELREKQKSIQLINGIFDVIVIDPPWPLGFNYDPEHWRGACPYPEMSLEQIKALKLPMSENCIVWLWTTNAFLHEAYHILEAWGLTPKTVLTWAKDKFGLGVWLRGQTEQCILATTGSPKINLTNQTTLLCGISRKHSQKPEEFYQMVDSLCFGSKLDYYAREKREGWDVYGTLEKC